MGFLNSGRAGCLRFLKFWFPVTLYSGIIFGASSLANVETPLPEAHFDKVLHIVEYAPFGFLFAFGLRSSKSSVSSRMLIGLSLLAAFLYGLSDEYHQSFVIGRSAGIDDAIADAVGGMFGGFIYRTCVWRRMKDSRST